MQHNSIVDTSLVNDIILNDIEPTYKKGKCITKKTILNTKGSLSISNIQINRPYRTGLDTINMKTDKVMTSMPQLIVKKSRYKDVT